MPMERRIMSRNSVKTLVTGAVVVIALVLVTTPAVRSKSGSEDLGGTFTQLNAPQTYGSPCEAATVTGGVNFKAVVRVDDWGGRTDVRVSVTFHSDNETDGNGNTFTVNGSAHAQYDTLSDHYTLPTNLDYDTANKSLSFLGPTDTTVYVDPLTQKPTSFLNGGFPPTCDQH
jgi:hypothetical protein